MRRLAMHRLLILTIALAAAAPAIAKTPPPSCSAARLPALAPQPGLPAPVAKTRKAIAEAARRCDYAGLERLGLAGRREFNYDWEHHGRPAVFWRRMEAEGKPILATMVALLTLPALPPGSWPMRGYVWVDVTTHPKATRAAFLKFKVEPYYHLTIMPDGDWVELVIGD
jgi:hypothetical protein